jgi:hypothetical protein
LRNKAKSRAIKSSEEGGWGRITMLLLVADSVVFRDVWANAFSWWRSKALDPQIFCSDLWQTRNSVCQLVYCSVTVFVDEFLNFVNTVCRFAGAWSPWTFVIFNWYSTGLETWKLFRNRCPA